MLLEYGETSLFSYELLRLPTALMECGWAAGLFVIRMRRRDNPSIFKDSNWKR